MRFSEVDIQGLAKEATVKRKNIIVKLTEFRNGLYGLTSRLTFVDGVVMHYDVVCGCFCITPCSAIF